MSHARAAAAADHPDLALELLIAAASNAFWAAHVSETRDAIREAAASLGAPSRDPRQIAIEAFIAPAEDISDVVTLLQSWQGVRDLSADGLLLLGSAAFAACDHELTVGFLSASVDRLRVEGRLERLAQALVMRAWSGIHVGRWDLAAPDAQEAFLLSEETAQPIWGAGGTAALAWLAAVRGQDDAARELVVAAERVALPARSRAVCSLTTLTRGMLALAHGESEVAYQHLRRMLDPTDLAHHQMTSAWGIAGLADAAVAIGRAPEADALIADLAERGERRELGVHRRVLAHACAVLADMVTQTGSSSRRSSRSASLRSIEPDSSWRTASGYGAIDALSRRVMRSGRPGRRSTRPERCRGASEPARSFGRAARAAPCDGPEPLTT